LFVNTKRKEKRKKYEHDKQKEKKKRKKKEKSKNRISCQDQGVSCLNTKGLFTIKGILVTLSFECE